MKPFGIMDRLDRLEDAFFSGLQEVRSWVIQAKPERGDADGS